jgi:hypothetical protein
MVADKMTPHEHVMLELKIINKMFDELKVIQPMVVFIKDDNRIAVAAEFHSDIHKDIVSQGIKDLVAKSEPDVVIYVAEAWAVTLPSGFFQNYPRPADHKDRVEIICAQIEFKTGEKYSCSAKILREGGNARLDKFEISKGGMTMGRFVDFFPVKNVN